MYSLPKTNILSIYWAPYMRATSHVLSYTESLNLLKLTLLDVRKHDKNKNIFIDQLNFYDNTPGYESNSIIEPSQLPSFLANLSPLLKKYTIGYALWTYRNTTANYVYNASFSNMSMGWLLKGRVSFASTRSLSFAKLSGGSSVSQLIGINSYKPPADISLKTSFLFKSLSRSSIIKIVAGNYSRYIVLRNGNKFSKETIVLPPMGKSTFNYAIEDRKGSIDITQVSVYTYEAIGKVLRQNGTPDVLLNSIIKLNREL